MNLKRLVRARKLYVTNPNTLIRVCILRRLRDCRWTYAYNSIDSTKTAQYSYVTSSREEGKNVNALNNVIRVLRGSGNK